MSISKSMRDRLIKRKEALSKRGSGNFKFFIFKEGTSRMRLVPVDPDEEFAVEATFFFLPNNIGGIVSPVTFNEPCAIMEAYQKLKKSKDEDDRKLADKIKPKKRYFALHIKYEDEKGKNIDFESGVKLAILTNQQYNDLIDLYLDEENGDMTDPLDGYDIKYKREGKGLTDTQYSVIRCKPTPLHKKFRDKIYDPKKALKKIIPTYEETQDIVEKIMGGSMDDEKPSFKKKNKKSTGDM